MSNAAKAPTPASMMGLTSLRSRLVLSTVGLVSVVMLIVGTGGWIVLAVFAQRDVANVLDEQANTLVTDVTASSSQSVVVQPNDLQPGQAVYDTTGRPVAGVVAPQASEVAVRLAREGRARTMRAGDGLSVRGVPFTVPGGERLVAIVSVDRTPYERSELYALLAMVGLGITAVGLTGVVTRRVTSRALEPVATMAERAADWSEHNLQQRFGLGPPTNELEALAETLDHLLDRVAGAIRSEQRLTSELAHELRTPLTSIQGAADLALMRGVQDPVLREDLDQIRDSARSMATTITQLLEIARDLGHAHAGDTCTVADVVRRAQELVRPPLVLADATRGSRAAIAAPESLVMRALTPVLENACHYAASQVTIAVEVSAREVVIEITDDGAGVLPGLRGSLFEPGRSGTGGTGLGLAISRRIARSLGGEVRLGEASGSAPGARLLIELPRA
jgi:signal transduction histidine kinase